MERLQTLNAILDAIAALPAPTRQRLVVELRRRGYLDDVKTEAPPVSEPEYRVQFTKEADGTFCATLTGWAGCKAFGRNPLETIQNLILLVGAQVSNSDLLSLQPASTLNSNDFPIRQDAQDCQKAIAYLEDYRSQLAAGLHGLQDAL